MNHGGTERTTRHACNFLSRHANGLKVSAVANTEYRPTKKHSEARQLIVLFPEAYDCAITPICRFILDLIISHDAGAEDLREAFPFLPCEARKLREVLSRGCYGLCT